jgi:hypothetical protein
MGIMIGEQQQSFGSMMMIDEYSVLSCNPFPLTLRSVLLPFSYFTFHFGEFFGNLSCTKVTLTWCTWFLRQLK